MKNVAELADTWQDLFGSAPSAIGDDDFDVAKLQMPTKVPIKTSSMMDVVGMNLLQKLAFFAVIVGLVLVFLRVRRRSPAMTEKFPA